MRKKLIKKLLCYIEVLAITVLCMNITTVSADNHSYQDFAGVCLRNCSVELNNPYTLNSLFFDGEHFFNGATLDDLKSHTLEITWYKETFTSDTDEGTRIYLGNSEMLLIDNVTTDCLDNVGYPRSRYLCRINIDGFENVYRENIYLYANNISEETTVEITTIPETTKKAIEEDTTNHATQTTTITLNTTTKKQTLGKVQIKKALKKKNSKKAKITLKQIKGAKGYEIKISTKKNFSKKTTKAIRTSKISFTIKKLKVSKKAFYVKARAYKTINKKKQYGPWSKTKRTTTK